MAGQSARRGRWQTEAHVRHENRLAAALAVHNAGAPQKYVLFWGHRPERNGRTGRGCFSQWWPVPVSIGAVTYPTAEHWMMAEKARLFDDKEGLARVLAARSPGTAKAAGREIRGFDEDRWAEARYDIVVTGTLAKFSQHPDLARVLGETGAMILVEASPTDRVWGIGLSANDEAATDPSRWPGLNLLGFALMDVRETLAG
jgi:ribA/ribD-fused uncharacterized protein